VKNYLNVNIVFFQEKTYTMHEICFLLFVLLCFPWGEGSVLKLYNLEVLKENQGSNIWRMKVGSVKGKSISKNEKRVIHHF